MDQNLVYAKTPNGDDAVRQSTRVVQRNLRMVLVQVDGKTTVAELGAKIGNAKMVETALRDLEEGGFIAPILQAPSVWEQGKKAAQELKAAASQFSTFGAKSIRPDEIQSSGLSAASAASAFSTFGEPLSRPDFPLDELAKPSADEEMAAMMGGGSRFSEDEPRSRRFRPIILLWLALAGILVLCIGVVVYPYNNFKPDIEVALTRAFQSPVKIGNVALGLLPRPALTLQGLEIGSKGEARIDEVRIPSLLFLVGSGQRQIQNVEIAGLSMPADGLGALVGMPSDSSRKVPEITIGHARLQRVTIRMNDIVLSKLEGEMAFKANGALDKVRLQSEDRTLRIEAAPTMQGAMLNIEGLAWKPLEGSPYTFESMQAKGLLQPGRLVLSDVDTTFLGGVLKGSWLLTWNGGLAMAGEASLARMNARRVAEIFVPSLKLEGELSGALRLRGSGKDWQTMWQSVEASLDLDIARGVLSGVDIGEAARRGGRNTRGGATKFDRLRGVIVIDPQQITGRDVRLEAGLISAIGRFAANRESRVDGAFDVSIGSSVSSVRMPIKVSGTLPDMVVTAGR